MQAGQPGEGGICEYHIIAYSALDAPHAGARQTKSGVVPLLKAKNNILTSRGQRSVRGNGSWEAIGR